MKKYFFAVALSLLAVTPFQAHAVSFQEAIGVRPNNPIQPSSDPVQFNMYPIFDPFTSNSILSFGSFNGHSGGTLFEVFLLASVTRFDGFPNNDGVYDATRDNAFGLLSGGNLDVMLFSSVLANSNPVPTASRLLSENQTYTMAINGRGGFFTSIDTDNDGDRPHFVGLQVTNPGLVVVPARLEGNSTTFNLLLGDYIIMAEDRPLSGNTDFDYNDFVMVVRATQVPEPSTWMLLSLGLLGGIWRARKKAC